jgi:SAM-dependent methyltransferase
VRREYPGHFRQAPAMAALLRGMRRQSCIGCPEYAFALWNLSPMLIEKLWQAVRPFVPVQFYPILAPVYRWRRRVQLKRIEEGDRRYLAVHPGLKVPPPELRYNVVGPCTIEQFLRGGEQTVDDIEAALRSIDKSLSQIRELLDFGCGCGRLVSALQGRRLTDLRVTACDVDERAIRWCRQSLENIKFVANDALPPSPFENESFDLVWCGSVFTHLDENHQDLWLDEINRILKPNGILLASVHGPHLWEPRLPSWTIGNLRTKGLVFARTGADAGIHPSWYQVAWHTEKYIREHWASVFEIRGYRPRGFNDYQDIVVAQKKIARTHG